MRRRERILKLFGTRKTSGVLSLSIYITLPHQLQSAPPHFLVSWPFACLFFSFVFPQTKDCCLYHAIPVSLNSRTLFGIALAESHLVRAFVDSCGQNLYLGCFAAEKTKTKRKRKKKTQWCSAKRGLNQPNSALPCVCRNVISLGSFMFFLVSFLGEEYYRGSAFSGQFSC